MDILEVVGVFTGIAYVLLAAKGNIWCWPFGLLSSICSILLFYQVQLYAEAFLYIYYVAAAIYGWWNWNRITYSDESNAGIVSWKMSMHWIGVVSVFLLGLFLGWILNSYTSAAYPWVDAQTTVFSFWATYLTTRKVIENWLYWILIDATSIGLYWGRGLDLYAGLMVLYTGMAIWGYWQWRRKLVWSTLN